jgi:hypothetical protein
MRGLGWRERSDPVRGAPPASRAARAARKARRTKKVATTRFTRRDRVLEARWTLNGHGEAPLQFWSGRYGPLLTASRNTIKVSCRSSPPSSGSYGRLPTVAQRTGLRALEGRAVFPAVLPRGWHSGLAERSGHRTGNPPCGARGRRSGLTPTGKLQPSRRALTRCRAGAGDPC